MSAFDHELALALRSAPALKEIRVNPNYYLEDWVRAGYFTTITKSQTLQTIRCDGILGRDEVEAAMQACGMSARAVSMFTFIETESDRSL